MEGAKNEPGAPPPPGGREPWWPGKPLKPDPMPNPPGPWEELLDEFLPPSRYVLCIAGLFLLSLVLMCILPLLGVTLLMSLVILVPLDLLLPVDRGDFLKIGLIILFGTNGFFALKEAWGIEAASIVILAFLGILAIGALFLPGFRKLAGMKVPMPRGWF